MSTHGLSSDFEPGPLEQPDFDDGNWTPEYAKRTLRAWVDNRRSFGETARCLNRSKSWVCIVRREFFAGEVRPPLRRPDAVVQLLIWRRCFEYAALNPHIVDADLVVQERLWRAEISKEHPDVRICLMTSRSDWYAAARTLLGVVSHTWCEVDGDKKKLIPSINYDLYAWMCHRHGIVPASSGLLSQTANLTGYTPAPKGTERRGTSPFDPEEELEDAGGTPGIAPEGQVPECLEYPATDCTDLALWRDGCRVTVGDSSEGSADEFYGIPFRGPATEPLVRDADAVLNDPIIREILHGTPAESDTAFSASMESDAMAKSDTGPLSVSQQAAAWSQRLGGVLDLLDTCVRECPSKAYRRVAIRLELELTPEGTWVYRDRSVDVDEVVEVVKKKRIFGEDEVL